MIDHEENAPCMNPVEFGFFYLILAYFTNVFSRDSQLYKRVCLSVRRLVRPSVGRSVGNQFVKINANE